VVAKLEAQTQSPWVSRVSATPQSLSGAAYGAGLYVVVGDVGAIVTSPDGVTWTSRTSTTTNSLRSVCFGGGRFVAVGAVGTILTSANGITWKKETSNTTAFLSGVTYGAGKFVAVGGNGTGITSADGMTWVGVDTAAEGLFLQGVIFAGGRFLTYGRESAMEDGEIHGTVRSSLDGTMWTTVTTPVSSDVYTMAHFRGRYYTGGRFGECFSSADLVNWRTEDAGIYTDIHSMATDGHTLVATSEGGGIRATGDGTVWTPVTSGVASTLFGALFAEGRFVVVGGVSSGRGTILTTPQDPVVTAGYDSWKALKFTTEEQADLEISGINADPDHDGLSNLAEYAHGLNPKGPDAGSGRVLSLKSPLLLSGGVELGWIHDVTSSEGVDIIVRYSDDLEAGSWRMLEELPAPLARDGDLQAMSVVDTAPAATRRFYRLEYVRKD
jgi:hypothetical protein